MSYASRFATLALLPVLMGVPHAASGEEPPTVLKAEGDVKQVDSEGKESPLAAGQALTPGLSIRTGEGASAQIGYPDGTEVFVGAGSAVGVGEVSQDNRALDLEQGMIRSVVQKLTKGTNKPALMIRTKSAVMGVRGTDFFTSFDAASSQAEVHTLEGTVEVAKDEATVLQNQGAQVGQNQMVSAGSSGVGPVQAFDPKAFLDGLQATQPFLAAAQPQVPSAPSAPGAGAAISGAGALAGLLAGGGDDDKKDEEKKEEGKKEEAKEPEDDAIDTWGLKITRFVVSLSSLSPAEGESSGFQHEFSWTPEIRFADAFALRGHLGYWPNAFEMDPAIAVTAPEEVDSMLLLGGHAEATVWKGLTVGASVLLYNILNTGDSDESLQKSAGVHAEVAWRLDGWEPLDRVGISFGTVNGFGENLLGAPADDFTVFRFNLGVRL